MSTTYRYAMPQSAAESGPVADMRPSIRLYAMNPAELREFADTLGIDGPRADLPIDVRTALHRWCTMSANSLDHAKAGRQDVYDRLADECGRLYDSLPDRYQW